VKSLRVKVAVGVLIGGLIALLWFTLLGKRVSTAQPINVSLQFGGFSTNAATGRVLAMFSVSNSHPWKVEYREGLPQAKTNGSWSQVQITEGSMKFIRPGESINFLVSVPGTTSVWRLPVVLLRTPSRTEGLLYRARQKIATVTENYELAPSLTVYTILPQRSVADTNANTSFCRHPFGTPNA
jgi:hypothetical protein